MSAREIKPGDYVDVRMIAVGADNRRVTVRLPGASAVHQVTIGDYLVQNVETRTPEAIAADVVCSSYDGRAPLARR